MNAVKAMISLSAYNGTWNYQEWNHFKLDLSVFPYLVLFISLAYHFTLFLSFL